MVKMINILELTRKKKKSSLFLFILILDNFYTLTISLIINLINPKLIDVFNGDEFTKLNIFIGSVIFGPLIETFIFQFLIIEILLSLKLNKNLILLISTILFSLSHNYNVIYIIAMLFPGLLYSSYYLFLKVEKRKNIFLTIFILHSLSNLIAFILDDILNI